MTFIGSLSKLAMECIVPMSLPAHALWKRTLARGEIRDIQSIVTQYAIRNTSIIRIRKVAHVPIRTKYALLAFTAN